MLLEDDKRHVIKPLVHIFNLSIYTGHVPSIMKLPRVVPIFKVGDTGNICLINSLKIARENNS